jgi:hypothetical protein
VKRKRSALAEIPRIATIVYKIQGSTLAHTTMANDGYYDFFDRKTNSGIVLRSDLSSRRVGLRELAREETNEREGWTNTLQVLKTHYIRQRRPPTPPRVTTWEGVLRQRIVAARLGISDVSSRSTVAEPRETRMYPNTISVWNDFESQVRIFSPSPTRTDLNPRDFKIFERSVFFCDMARRNESEEQQQLLENLHITLVQSGMVLEISTSVRGVEGRPDFVLKMPPSATGNNSANISVVGESKSTHNLRLPIRAGQIVEKYNVAYQTVVGGRQGRTLEWGNVCHPIAQLLGYMVDNKRRYGALTSGTRTYFVYISGNCENSIVHISNAWFVGQVNYVRAWAYIYTQGCEQLDTLPPPRWLEKTPDPTPEKRIDDTTGGPKRKRNDDNTGGPNRRNEGRGRTQKSSRGRSKTAENAEPWAVASGELPHVSYNDFEIVDVLGFGRNGTVFKVRWRGQEAAMKQFDVGKDGYGPFDSELAAYMKLRDAWGVLVPTPLFLSKSVSGGVMFLGLELGRDPKPGDDVYYQSEHWPNLLRSLEEYGIHHSDAEERNALFIKDANGSDRLVAIDLEHWYEVS